MGLSPASEWRGATAARTSSGVRNRQHRGAVSDTCAWARASSGRQQRGTAHATARVMSTLRLLLTVLSVALCAACGSAPGVWIQPSCSADDAGCETDAHAPDGHAADAAEATAADTAVDAGILDATPPDAAARSELTPDAYDVAFIERYCGKILECCSVSEAERLFGGVTDVASCVSFWSARTEATRLQVRAAVTAGRMRFDALAAEACLGEVSTLRCPGFNRWFGPASCEAAYAGQVADGEPCTTFDECASTRGSCVAAEGAQRRCVPSAAVGEPCGPDVAQCAAVGRCVGSGGFPPEAPVCNAELDLGATCVVGSQCASQTCGTSNTCEPTPPLCAG